MRVLFPNRLTKEQFLLFGLDEPPKVVQKSDGLSFLESIRKFAEFGAPTRHFVEGGIPYYVNEFWTAGQRQAHSLHEVSYRACFKAQLPEFFISRLTKIGETVHDPFMGRGTTPIQAGLMGRKPSGSDVNPLSVLLARPRLRPPNLADVAQRLKEVPWDKGDMEHDELLAFFHPQTLRHLNALRQWLSDTAPIEDKEPDPVVDWIRMVSINRLTGHSPGFFSGRTMPPNQAVSIIAQRRMNERGGREPPPRNVIDIILKKSRSLVSDGMPPDHEVAQFFVRPAHSITEVGDQSVDLVVTSPPFLDTVQYADDNWLRCWFAGIEIDRVDIAMHKTESAWTAFVHEALAEQARILKRGGHLAFEVGEVRGGKVLLERLVWQAAEGLPFERQAVIVNQQEFTKTANCWGVSNNAKGTNTNRIVLLRRL